jgi:hypothetical protein
MKSFFFFLTERYGFVENLRCFKFEVTDSHMKRLLRNCCNTKLSQSVSYNFSFLGNTAGPRGAAVAQTV